MSMREALDLSAYLVIGPENTKGRPVKGIIRDVVAAGFTIVQVRSKVASAKELIGYCRDAAEAIAEAGRADRVALVADDRLDVVLAAREAGIKVDGIHVGQSDIPAAVCRKYLGDDAVIGLSARTRELIDYVRTADISDIDYFGAGPLHETATKPEAGRSASGRVITRSLEEIAELARVSPVPAVIGGGVKLADIPDLKRTGIAGFFVVSTVTEADDPGRAAAALTAAWRA
ncbi:putative thiamine-phosphate diphosphorylase [Pseudoramibacter alactolyticus ATCC 23263]|uniref:Thiamine-phosphate synthase n=1 Tax=Pseudoramibacter alactolyticus ATCC 23263 TaxID=887929 RepID=E6MHF8_9FIRM|nr:thiamine phosphate synthase [Pseudoramibacter alactolyticus]EFV01460.1 putative thiamine-phosphate diphosphorylase [Pseudoramibacter alactolyticus ATCC 23263]